MPEKLLKLSKNAIFAVDEHFVEYRTVFGKPFRVPRAVVNAVIVDYDAGFSLSGKLRVMGNGGQLAELKLPRPWANQAQTFIMSECGLLG